MLIDLPTSFAAIEISGEPYEVGFELGRFGSVVVNEYLTKTQAWAGIIAHRHDPRVLRMHEQVQEQFPRYWMEIMGLANGLDLPFEEVFAWNCRGDIRALAPDGCTTVQVPGARRIIAHNEDGDPGFQGHCALVRISSAGGTPFTAFVYPGSLPGHTFAETDAGLVQTVNNIRALDAGNGIPRMVLTRAMLDCQNLDEAVTLLQTSERAGAFHVTLAAVGDPRLLSVEFTAETCSLQEIMVPSAHANHLIHDETAHIRQTVTGSSASRQRRGDTLVHAMVQGSGDAHDPLVILRDKAGPELPIQRDDPDDPDHENTLATAVFIIEGEKIDWTVYDKADAPARFYVRGGLVSAA